MKISEFIVEGPRWDKFTNAVSNIPGGGWLARRGALGRTAQIGAYGKLQDKEQKAFNDTLFRSMGVKFKTDLKRNLDAAMQAGRIATPLSESSSYSDFNTLLESSIINEAPITLTQWFKDYIDTLTSKYVKTPDQETNLDSLITGLVNAMKAANYTADVQMPNTEVDKLWSAIWEIRSMQQPGVVGDKKYPMPSGTFPSGFDPAIGSSNGYSPGGTTKEFGFYGTQWYQKTASGWSPLPSTDNRNNTLNKAVATGVI